MTCGLSFPYSPCVLLRLHVYSVGALCSMRAWHLFRVVCFGNVCLLPAMCCACALGFAVNAVYSISSYSCFLHCAFALFVDATHLQVKKGPSETIMLRGIPTFCKGSRCSMLICSLSACVCVIVWHGCYLPGALSMFYGKTQYCLEKGTSSTGSLCEACLATN